MIKKTTVNVLLLAFFTVAAACAQVDNSSDRKEQIKANLIFLFPQLEEHHVELNDFEESGTAGMDLGRFIVNGQQEQPFLVTADNSKLFLITGGPYDVSKTESDLADLMAARKEAARQKAKEIHEDLMPAIADLPYRGAADAPVTIVEFSDFQCPYCARATDTMHQLIAKHAEDVKLVYVQFPLESIHPWARAASIASLCAANQSDDAFWELHDKYFEDQRELNAENVIAMSKGYLDGMELDIEQWESCAANIESAAYKTASSVVDDALALGVKHGVSSTPAFFVNGHLVNGAQPLETFEEALKEAMEE